MDMGKASCPPPARPRPRRCRPHSLPLTFALGSRAIETAMRCSAAPQHQLREEGAAAGGGAGGGGGGAGGGAGARRRGQGGGADWVGCREGRRSLL